MASTTCRKCGVQFEQTEAARKRSVYQCIPCRTASNRRWRERRAAAGIRSVRPPLDAEARRRAYQRDAALYHSDPERKRRQKARAKLRKYVERGLIVRQPCEVCGAAPAHGHHDDYAKPLDVRWFCAPHHTAHHRALVKEA